MSPEYVYVEFYLNHFDRIVNMATKYVGDKEEATDLVQGRVARSLQNNYETAEGLANWVAVAVRNQCLNFISQAPKRKKRHKQFSNIHDVPPPSPEEVMVNKIQSHVIEDLISNLSPQLSKVMFLLYIQGLSLDEVAEKLNVSKRTVKNHRLRALEVLRKQLKTTKEKTKMNKELFYEKIKNSSLPIATLARLYKVGYYTIVAIKSR